MMKVHASGWRSCTHQDGGHAFKNVGWYPPDRSCEGLVVTVHEDEVRNSTHTKLGHFRCPFVVILMDRRWQRLSITKNNRIVMMRLARRLPTSFNVTGTAAQSSIPERHPGYSLYSA